MASMENEQCKSCACDYFQAKGRNIRRFWEYVGVVIGVMLILYLFGSCFGCSACFECAAACDSSCGCELESCGREFYEEVGCGSCSNSDSECSSCKQSCAEDCDNCVRSDGVNCGNTENCGACAGFGDCSACKGYKVYRVTIVVGDKEYEVKLYDKSEKLPIYYPDGAGAEYFEFLGYWTKEEQGGKRYVTSEGEYVAGLEAKDGLTLYPDYQELGVDQSYSFAFDTAEVPADPSFVAPSPITVTVGSAVEGFPEPQEIDGYNFKGWYTYDNICVTDEDGYYKSDLFHLYDVGVLPNDITSTIVLFAKYEKQSYPIQLVEVRDGIAFRTETVNVEYGEYLRAHVENTLNTLLNDGETYRYLGLSREVNPDITDSTKVFDLSALDSVVVEEAQTLYVIKRTVAVITIHYGVNLEDVRYSSYYGETVNLNNIQDLNQGMKKVGELVEREGFNPGYKFTGWCQTQNASPYADSYTEITIGKGVRLDYYARWEITTYTITYRSASGGFIGSDTYQYQTNKQLMTLSNDGSKVFAGWCYLEDLSDTPMTSIPAGSRYGDLVLYAKYYG